MRETYEAILVHSYAHLPKSSPRNEAQVLAVLKLLSAGKTATLFIPAHPNYSNNVVHGLLARGVTHDQIVTPVAKTAHNTSEEIALFLETFGSPLSILASLANHQHYHRINHIYNSKNRRVDVISTESITNSPIKSHQLFDHKEHLIYLLYLLKLGPLVGYISNLKFIHPFKEHLDR